jgi:hypothetical protein
MDIEWLILADSAQVVGGKLYLLGGGWDHLMVNKSFPADQRFALALSIRVPWIETNQKHNFELEVISEDAATEAPKSMMKAGGQFEIGRPPGILPGQEQRFQLALDGAIKIENEGAKTVIARIDGQEMRRISFYVHAGTQNQR